jgi:hypothetical protein
VLYAQLAQGDTVRRLVRAQGPLRGEYEAAPGRTEDGLNYLPTVVMIGYGESPGSAIMISRRAATAFQTYIERTQDSNGVAPSERTQLQLVNVANEATVFKGRSLTKPLFSLLLVLLITIGLAFFLENLRPRIRSLPVERARTTSLPRSG